MNLQAIAALIWMASVACSFWFGIGHGRDAQKAETSKIEQAIQETRTKALEGAADAISKIKLQRVTVQGRVETIVRDNPVYRDCEHDPSVLRDLNDALSGRGQSKDRPD